MDIGKSFTFIFDDEEWVSKLLIGALFVLASAVVVGIPFLLGYMVRIVRNVMQGKEKPLPGWDDLGDLFKEGLILAVIFVIWAIPSWGISVFQSIIGALLSTSYDMVRVYGVLSTCLGCLSALWGLVMAIFTPALVTRYANAPEFKTGFEFAELWQFTRDNLGNIVIALLLGALAVFVSSFGVILCVIGVFATLFWAYTIVAHLYGQVYVAQKTDLVMSGEE